MPASIYVPLATDVTASDFLANSAYEHSELINGETRPKPLGTDEHSSMEIRLVDLLRKVFGRRRVRHELNVRVSDDTVLVPDVVVKQEDMSRLVKGVLVDAPLLCVEVVPPSQSASELLSKCERYHAFGVPYCWVVDPVAKRGWDFHLGASSHEAVSFLSGPCDLSFTDLFAAEEDF